MKKIVSICTLLLAIGTLSAQPQCLMTAHLDTATQVIMTMPNGLEMPVGDSTILREYGDYRLLAIVDEKDTMSLSFTLTGEEEMETTLKAWSQECSFVQLQERFMVQP